MNKKSALILETEVLATDYYFYWAYSNCENILKVFREYFKLTENDTSVSKRVFGNAMQIISTFYRHEEDIPDEYRIVAENNICKLQSLIENCGTEGSSNIVEGIWPKYDSDNLDELRHYLAEELKDELV